ncbi:BREX-1 system adenine-specific DNA-methyltransferase PglX [Peribacillus frigoritolerans]|uniref:BREX-1 system adenine-specific DNA-methyltransferase PglX n=1 Tax=Peribacillus castrilensis TaxID=2897690 RepID=UPI00296F24F7|nr:BREX-1 system adenine-specific DNA-methyltransferase PglX [Peribacillus castrilensis]
MNKSALKTFATSARKELLKKVEAKAMKIGITEETIKKADIESSDAIFIDGKQLSKEEKIQRDKLITRIKQIGFKQVMEEVAYTWFNRFTALRFMEVNDYLPTNVRVLSSTNVESAEPDMINEALSLELEIDKEYVYNLKLNNKTEELFKYLIIKHCNDLNRYLPFMFETIDDYTEILFPEGLLAKDSFLRQMTVTDVIQEDDWGKIEIIGWLYQFYISEEKERVFKQKSKYKSEEIPFATQLFTPDWIVRYMVQNSLGCYWVESHPEHRDLIKNWDFYLENPNPEPDFEEKLAQYINKELKVEDIRCFDPAMGSGHILVYMFDVMYQIYSKCGYMDREIPRLIIENNLYGLDIDNRAYQLACFSVVMKALEYNNRFFRSIERNGLRLNLASIQETNTFPDDDVVYIAGEKNGIKFEQTKKFIEQFKDAKTVGSLIKVSNFEEEFLHERLNYITNNYAGDLFEETKRTKILELLPNLINQAKILSNTYDILVTNPPYMGLRNMNSALSNFVYKHYPDSKADLFSCFMELDHLLKQGGFYSLINQQSWMFLSSFEELREKIVEEKTISTMLHLGPRTFEEIGGEVVQSTAFVLRNVSIAHYKGIYIRLINEKTSEGKKIKTLEVIKNPSSTLYYLFNQDDYKKIPTTLIAYWASGKMLNIFSSSETIEEQIKFKQGMATSNNDRFLRYFHEVSQQKVGYGIKDREEARKSKLKWFPYNKGGYYRKWYGNNEYVVNWENDGEELKEFTSKLPQGTDVRLKSKEYYFKRGLTWSALTSGNLSVRYSETGFIFDTKGSMGFPYKEDDIYYIIGLLNSKVSIIVLEMLAPTLDFNLVSLKKIPYIKTENTDILNNIKNIVLDNISISKNDWDSFETSWDFQRHPILLQNESATTIEQAINGWSDFLSNQVQQLKKNEQELNRFFINIYGLQDELSSEVKERDVSLNKMDKERDIKSFISYFIGCIFGRYSLDEEGLVYAGGEFDINRYSTFKADKDNILPILTGAYFKDDIVSKFIEFVKMTFGKETLDENLDFIADTLGKKKGDTAKETIRRYFLNDFFKDHAQTYKKRPVYWLFTSGKQKAFNCLIYMHRYDRTTLSRIRTDYLHEYQIRLDAEKKDLLSIIEGDYSTKEISNAKKEIKALDKKIEELKEYDELLHHMADMQIEIDLDDGVVVNYEKFKGLVAKI